MELTELQATWQLFNKDVIDRDTMSESSMADMIHKRSKTEISGIRRSMFMKFILGSAATLVGLTFMIATSISPEFNPMDFALGPMESMVFFGVLVISLCVMLWFNYKAFRLIDKITDSSYDLKSAIEKFTIAMKTAMRFNIYSDTFMSPVFITWVYYAYAFKDHELAMDLRTTLLVIMPVVIGVFAFYFQQFAQRLKFGRYVERLEEYIESLNEENSEKV